ncbi:MAG: hypothetical protein WD063_13880 [Pirellulales bacterium]
MSACLTRGILTISVDLEIDVAHVGLAGGREIEELTARLLELFARYEMPATWAVADPAVSAAREPLAAARSGHELAILGDASWVGRAAGRGRFARELERRAARARAEGWPVDTLVLKTVLPIDHCDLAIKEGIIAARHLSAAHSDGSPRRLQPQSLRFGLWAFPVSITLPGTSRWLPGGGGSRAARFAIDEAISGKGLVHFVVDAPRLAARGRSGVRELVRVVEHAERRRRHGLLEVATLGATARKLARENHGRPSHSILRPAA